MPGFNLVRDMKDDKDYQLVRSFDDNAERFHSAVGMHKAIYNSRIFRAYHDTVMGLVLMPATFSPFFRRFDIPVEKPVSEFR